MNLYCENMVNKRRALGRSQSEFASFLHYSVQTVAKYESGASEMDLGSLIYAARFLELDIDSFLIGVDSKNNDFADHNDFDPNLFATNLVLVRNARKMSQKTLAALSLISSRSLKNYEAGKSIPSLTVFYHFCKALGVTAAEMLFEDLSTRREFLSVKKRSFRPAVVASIFFAIALLGSSALVGGSYLRSMNEVDSTLSLSLTRIEGSQSKKGAEIREIKKHGGLITEEKTSTPQSASEFD